MPFGFEFSTKYTLTGPDGTKAVFNDSTDVDFVGYATEISGLDSPEVRESAADVPQGDGGRHFDFFHGRRPVVITCEVQASTIAIRNSRLNKIRLASRALTSDATLKWTPSGNEEVFTSLRRQQPVRVTGGWKKTVQIPLVAARPVIESTTLYTASTSTWAATLAALSLTNSGDAVGGYLKFRTDAGPSDNHWFTNSTTGEVLKTTLPSSASNRRAFYMHLGRMYEGAGTSEGTATDGYYDPTTDFWTLAPGANTISVKVPTATGSTVLTAEWRNAWL